MHIMTSQLTAPLLFWTSEHAGWDDLIVRAFHEPDELTGWIEPVIPDTSLVLMTRGVMLMEQRIGFSTKLNRWPTVKDRLDFGPALLMALAAGAQAAGK